MLCIDCSQFATSKLQADDLIVLEYLKEQKAVTTQFSLSKKMLMNELELSIHRITMSLVRLEVLGMIDINNQAHKYFITNYGIKALQIIEEKIQYSLEGID